MTDKVKGRFKLLSHRARKRRSQRGYALIAVITISWAAMAFLLASASVLQSIASSSRLARIYDSLNEAAERGVEVVVEELNRGAWSRTPSQFDLAENIYATPAFTLEPWDGLDSSIVVKARVRKLTDSERATVRTFSVLHSPQLEPDLSSTTDYNLPPKSLVKRDYWRMVEVSASKSETSFVRSIRSVLQPQLALPPGMDSLPNIADKTIFPSSGVFGNNAVEIIPTDHLDIRQYDQTKVFGENNSDGSASYRLDIQSNRSITVGSANSENSASIEGNIKVSNNLEGAPSAVATVSSGSEVLGRALTRSGSADGLSSSNDLFPRSDDAIKSNADIVLAQQQGRQADGRHGYNINAPVSTGESETSLTQFRTAPVVTDPSSVDLGAAILQSEDSTLEGNSYSTPSLTNDSLSKAVNFIPGDGGAPTKIFVDGTSGGSDTVEGNLRPAVDFSSSFLKNSYTSDPSGALINPMALQIYYSGSRDVVLTLSSGNDFNGIIYAPNARIILRGNADFNGALVGDQVSIQPGSSVKLNLISDLDKLDPSNPPASSSGNTKLLPPTFGWDTETDDIAIFGYKAVTYQPIKDRLVP